LGTRSWLWTLRRDRDAFLHLDNGAKALDAEVTALRRTLDGNPRFEPFDTSRAFALYQKILAPAAPLLDGVHQLLIVPDGALQSLPFAVLVLQPPHPDPTGPANDVAWLTRNYAVTVLPSVGSLRALRQFTTAGHADAPFSGIGNPVLGAPPDAARGIKLASLFRGPLANPAAVRASLPPLPETADELRAVAKAMGAGEQDLYLGQRASEPVLRHAGLDRYRVIEFATHGLVSGDLPGLTEPALVLTPPYVASAENDGLLTASKVATFKVNADWVVLSACNTAAGDGTADAGGLSGLAKAFFYAGARSLLVSHWEVQSQATVILITTMFAELAKDPTIGRAEALRRAELAMIDSNSPFLAHPAVWAPFILAGEGGAAQ
jgi:CHAT domain-containing protein